MIGKGYAGEAGRGRRAAAFFDGDVILNTKRQGNILRALGLQDLLVGGEDKVILHRPADFLIASSDGNREAGGTAGIDCDVEMHRQGGSVEGRPQIRRGGW